jgi:SAM-dependent methyltransferase
VKLAAGSLQVSDECVEQRLRVQQAYDLWAETYDDGKNPILALEERILGGILPSLNGKVFVDVGCGTGRWLARIGQRTRSYFGLDLSRAMLARATGKPQLHGRLIQADCVCLPLRTGCADVILGSFLLGYLDPENLAGELSRISHSGSDLFLSEFSEDAVSHGWKRNFRHRGQLLELPIRSRSLTQVKDAFHRHRFDLVEVIESGFGEEEHPIFSAAGKEEVFSQARMVNAIWICHFRLGSCFA